MTCVLTGLEETVKQMSTIIKIKEKKKTQVKYWFEEKQFFSSE